MSKKEEKNVTEHCLYCLRDKLVLYDKTTESTAVNHENILFSPRMNDDYARLKYILHLNVSYLETVAFVI
jgi:hypothetical protein